MMLESKCLIVLIPVIVTVRFLTTLVPRDMMWAEIAHIILIILIKPPIKLPLNLPLNIPLNLLRLNVPAPEGHNWPRPFPPEGGVVNTIERCLCLSNKLLFCLVLVVTLSDLYMILKNHEILFWVLTILLKLVPRWFSGGTTPFTALPSSRRPQAQPVRYRLPKSFKHFSKTEVVLVIQW